jgi:hypothetical protein
MPGLTPRRLSAPRVLQHVTPVAPAPNTHVANSNMHAASPSRSHADKVAVAGADAEVESLHRSSEATVLHVRPAYVSEGNGSAATSSLVRGEGDAAKGTMQKRKVAGDVTSQSPKVVNVKVRRPKVRGLVRWSWFVWFV